MVVVQLVDLMELARTGVRAPSQRDAGEHLDPLALAVQTHAHQSAVAWPPRPPVKIGLSPETGLLQRNEDQLNDHENLNLIQVPLADAEIEMLAWGLTDSAGPARFTDALAHALGFSGVEGLESDGDRLANAVRRGDGLSVRDWTRALAVAEVVFVSAVFNGEWCTVHGGSDEQWLVVLRGLQSKVPHDRDELPDQT